MNLIYARKLKKISKEKTTILLQRATYSIQARRPQAQSHAGDGPTPDVCLGGIEKNPQTESGKCNVTGTLVIPQNIMFGLVLSCHK